MKTTGRQDGEYRHYKDINYINDRVKLDLKEFIFECEDDYEKDIVYTAGFIASRMEHSRVVMLSGPSGSGKTTSAGKLSAALEKRGIEAHMLSMDNYFLSKDLVDPKYDFESPMRLDIPLLQEHITALSEDAAIEVPEYDFLTGMRKAETIPLKIGKDEIVIFEGIHALNDMFIEKVGHRPTGVYVSPRMRVTEDNNVILPPESLRFMRRSIRDKRTRGADFLRTLELWEDVRQGEADHIMPNKWRADIVIDTTLEYEIGVLKSFVQCGMRDILESGMINGWDHGMSKLPDELDKFADISSEYVPKSSLLREFIGEKL